MTVVEFTPAAMSDQDAKPGEGLLDPDAPLAHFDSTMSDIEVKKALLAARINYSIAPGALAFTMGDIARTRGATFEELQAMRAEFTQLHRAKMSHPIGERALAS